MGGDGEGVGAGGKASEKGRGKGKGKGKSKQEGQKTAQKEEGAQNDVKKGDNVGKKATAEEDPKSKCTAGDNGSGNNKKVESGGSGSNTNELLQEATKLLKSLHLPAAKKITLQELGNPQLGPSDLMLLDSGATHSLRRAKSWEEWEGSHQTVVALAQGTTSKLRIKPGTETLLSTPDDDSFGNGILPMGALTKIGYEVSWSGGDCRVRGSGGEKVEVQVVNGCPMVEKQVGMKMMDQLEHHSCVATARMALVRAILQQPGLMRHMADLDATTLLSIMLKKEFPDLPESICAKIVPKATEVQGDQLPWNRRLRRRMMKARRIVLHLFSGSDEKTWKQLEDANTMVICLDRVLNPKMDMLNDHIMLFLMKLATTGALQAVLGGPPCRTVSACRYTNDNGPAPVRSEEEPYGLASLSPQQKQWVEDDIAMFFGMKLIYMIAVHHKPDWCDKVLFGLEQPQDPKEYRSEQDIQQYQYMSVWRMASWQHFQEKYKLMRTSFEQGAFGHVKPKPTTIAHNINGLEELQGAKAPRDCHQGGWKDRPLQERIQESATWAQWAPGLKAAIIEGLRRQFQKMDAGRCHLGAPGNAEEATWDSECDNPKPLHQQPQLCPLSEVALAKWKAHVLHDHQPMRRDCRACVEAAGQSRHHRRVRHPSAYCLAVDLSGKLKRGKDQFGATGTYFLVGCYTFPTTASDEPLCGPGRKPPPDDAPLPALDEMVEEDGVEGDMEDVELPRFEADVEEPPEDEDERAVGRAKLAYDSWMKLVETSQQVKVKTLTFTEVIASRATGHVMAGLAKIYSKVRSLGLPVLRLHADRARELTSKAVQSWCHSRDIIATYTSGSDWKSNGRAEVEIGLVKRHAKVLMRAHDIEEDLWPILVRHASERRLRWQLQQVGYPVPDLLPFNTKVFVKRKSWNQRYASWRWERSPGRVMGPDPWSSLTSGGYCVRLEDGKFLASTDVVVEQSELGEVSHWTWWFKNVSKVPMLIMCQKLHGAVCATNKACHR